MHHIPIPSRSAFAERGLVRPGAFWRRLENLLIVPADVLSAFEGCRFANVTYRPKKAKDEDWFIQLLFLFSSLRFRMT